MSALLHNMSVPSRTEVRAEKRGIADRIVVFSLTYALTVRGVLEKHERPENLPEGKEFEALPWGWLPGDRATIPARCTGDPPRDPPRGPGPSTWGAEPCPCRGPSIGDPRRVGGQV